MIAFTPKIFSKFLWLVLSLTGLIFLLFLLKPQELAPVFQLEYGGDFVQEGDVLETAGEPQSLTYGQDIVELGAYTQVRLVDIQDSSVTLALDKGSLQRKSFSGVYRFAVQKDGFYAPDLLLASRLRQGEEGTFQVEGAPLLVQRNDLWLLEGPSDALYPAEAMKGQGPDSLAYLKERTQEVRAWWHIFALSSLSKQELAYVQQLYTWYEAFQTKNFKALLPFTLQTEDAQWLRWWIATKAETSVQKDLFPHPAFASLFAEEAHAWLFMENQRRLQEPSSSSLKLFLYQLGFLEKSSWQLSDYFLKEYLKNFEMYAPVYWDEEALALWKNWVTHLQDEALVQELALPVHQDILRSFQAFLIQSPLEEKQALYEGHLDLLAKFSLEEGEEAGYRNFLSVLNSPEAHIYADFEKAKAQWEKKTLLLEKLNVYLQKWKSGEMTQAQQSAPSKVTKDSILSRLEGAGFENLRLEAQGDPSNRLMDLFMTSAQGNIHLKLDQQTGLIYELRLGGKRENLELFLQDFPAWWSKIGQDYL